MSMTENGAEKPEKFQPTYFFQPGSCGTKEQSWKVRDWLEQFGVPLEDEFYILWTETVITLTETLRGLEARKVSEESIKLLWDLAFSALYISYDTSKELIPQFRKNIEKLQVVLNRIEAESLGGLQNG